MKSIALTLAGLALLAVTAQGAVKTDKDVCQGVGKGVFLADLNNSRSYYVCMNGIAYQDECKHSLHFDAERQVCDEKDNVSPSAAEVCAANPQHLAVHAYPHTCNKFYMCFGGKPLQRNCWDDLQFNKLTDRCDFAKNVDCIDNMCNPVNDPNAVVYVPSHTKCDKYYICHSGKPHEYHCAKGLAYNSTITHCVDEKKVNCSSFGTARNITPLTKLPRQRAPITCPAKGVEFYPNPKNPSGYFLCSEGHSLVLDCTPGLVFDENTKACRDPERL